MVDGPVGVDVTAKRNRQPRTRLRGRQVDRDKRTVVVRDTPEGNVERGVVGEGCTCLDECDVRGRRKAKVVAGTGGRLRNVEVLGRRDESGWLGKRMHTITIRGLRHIGGSGTKRKEVL